MTFFPLNIRDTVLVGNVFPPKHVGNGQNLAQELISVHQTIKGDPSQGLPFFVHVPCIWALPVWGGGSKRLPRWFGALTVFGSIQPCRMVKNGPKKSAPECPVECGGGVQSLFGQCPNGGGVNVLGSSLRRSPQMNVAPWSRSDTLIELGKRY